MKNKLFTFLNPVFAYIDNGNFFRIPFQWLYVIIGVLNVLLPIGILIKVIDSGMLKYMSGKYIFFFILILIVLSALAWGSYLLWMNRKNKLKELIEDDNDFVAIPVMAHFTQTVGEWLGLYIGVGGCILTLLIFISNMDGDITGMLPLGFGISMCILYPIYGFLIVVGARVLAELYRAFAAIANNTRTIAYNTKNEKNVEQAKTATTVTDPETEYTEPTE